MTTVHKDPVALTMTITAQFDEPAERIWQVWADPRQLERWWGPPTHPATVVDHHLTPGGRVTYFMTGPEGEKYHGLWQVIVADPPHVLEFEDRFADENGEVDDALPTTTARVHLTTPAPGRTTMVITTEFRSEADMEQILAMGAEEGMLLALGQIDTVLAGPAPVDHRQ